MLASEMMVAFVDPGGLSLSFTMIGIFVVIALIPMAIAVATSPGDRWRELGLTLLIVAGIAAVCGITVVAVFNDPGMKQFMPPEPMPEFTFAPLFGFLNYAFFVGSGCYLYRRRAATKLDV